MKYFGLKISLVYKVIAHFESNVQCPEKIRQETFWTISSLHELNCFRYFLIHILRWNVSKKSGKKNFEPYLVFRCWIVLNFSWYVLGCLDPKKSDKKKPLNYIKSLCQKCFNTYILYTIDALKALLSKDWFYFFFLISDKKKLHHLLACHTISINSSFNSFLSVLHFQT